MSMLAEPKRKQHWTLNPRGRQWSEDSNKFGQKMLEKMGWSSGKGLGPKGEGMVEHIRVKVKNDHVGIGYDKNCDNQWTAQQDDFNKFLQNLQMEEPSNIIEHKTLTVNSLEEKSKKSQKRLHYKKFTKVKDVNKYNTKDLANIFGKKDFNDQYIHKTKEDKKISDPIGKQDKTAGILTIKGGYINDYFKKRFNTSEKSDTTPDIENSESDKEKYYGFGFQEKSEDTFNISDNVNFDCKSSENNYKSSKFAFTKCDEVKPKNKKHNDLNYVFDNPCLDLNILDENKTDNTQDLEKKDLEKKISKKRKHQLISQNTTESLDSSEKSLFKKQKTNVYINEGLDLDYAETPICINDNKIKSEITPENLDTQLKSTNISTKSKKKKKFEVSSNAYDNIALDLDCSDNTDIKKNQTQNICESNAYENLALDVSSTIPDNFDEEKYEKNVSNDISNPVIAVEHCIKSKNKKNKKNKKNNLASNGFINPGLDLNFNPDNIHAPNCQDSETYDVIQNIEQIECKPETTKKKKKKSKSDKVVNRNIEKEDPVPSAFVNEALDMEMLDNEVITESNKRNCKRRKNRRISVLETIEEVPEEKTFIVNTEDELKDSNKNLEILNLEPKINLDLDNSESRIRKKKRGIDIKNITPVSENIFLSNQKGKEIQVVKEIIRIKKKKVIDLDPTTEDQNCKNKSKNGKENVSATNDETKIVCCEKINSNEKMTDDKNCEIKCLNKNDCQEKIEKEKVQIEQKLEDPNNRNENKLNEPKKDQNVNYFQQLQNSKQKIKALFIKNPTLLFNGSNINELRGYGVAYPYH